MTKADPVDTASDFNLTGLSMGKLRTANKRHKRALVLAIETRRAAATSAEPVAPAQTDR